jgi:uncharacterized protein involved in outer membrane biogenesis
MRGRTLLALLLLLVLAVPVVAWLGLRAIDGGYLQRVVAQRVEAGTGRKLTVGGPVSVRWGLAPTVVVGRVALANAADASAPSLVEVRSIEVQLHLWSLLGGRLAIDRLSLHQPVLELERDAHGIGNWSLQPPAAAADAPEGGAGGPVLRAITVDDGTVRYRSRDTGEVTVLAITQGRLAGTGAGELEATGTLDGVPAHLAARVAEVEQVLSGALEAAGLSALTFTLGDTTLTGSAHLDWAPEQSVLKADLASPRLDLATFLDLEGTRSGPEPRPGPGVLAILTALDADVKLRAEELVLAGQVLRAVTATGKSRAGRLEIDPLAAELFGSPWRGKLLLDGGSEPERVALDASAAEFDVGKLLAGLGVTPLVEGRGELRVTLAGSGPTTAAWRAGAEGHLRFLMDEGRMSTELVERLAGGLRQLLASVTGGGQDDAAAIRCAALDMPIAQGTARPSLILDTDFTTLVAHGTVDLAHDRLDLVLSPQAKSLDLNLAVPVTVRGPIADPTFGLDESDAARRLASLLGSVIFPPAAIGAFVDFGSSGNNACLALAARPPQASTSPVGDALDAVKSGVEGVGRELRNLITPDP